MNIYELWLQGRLEEKEGYSSPSRGGRWGGNGLSLPLTVCLAGTFRPLTSAPVSSLAFYFKCKFRRQKLQFSSSCTGRSPLQVLAPPWMRWGALSPGRRAWF